MKERAKRLDNGELIHGHVFEMLDSTYMYPIQGGWDYFEIDPETIQYEINGNYYTEEELEALVKPKSCESCKFGTKSTLSKQIRHCIYLDEKFQLDFYCKHYEVKETTMNNQVGIQLHPLQVEAIRDNKAKAFISLVDMNSYVRPKITTGEYDRYVCEHCGHIANPFKDELICVGCFNELILELSPLQAGDRWFHQEKFIEGYEDIDNIEEECTKVWYKIDDEIQEWYYNEDDCVEVPWLDASEMTYEQSRLKGTTESVEVKKVQELVYAELKKILGDVMLKNSFNIEDWLDSIYGEGTFVDNPYVLLYTTSSN